MAKRITQMQAEVVAFCRSKGWYDEPVPFLQAMALLHSEVSEAVEAYRIWGLEDATEGAYYEDGTLHDGTRPKPEGVGSEFADVYIRLLDNCERFGVDLELEYERKMAYNRTRPYRHGGKAA